MNIYMLGDFQGDNGPGIANKMLKEGLEKSYQRDISYYYSHGKTIFQRIIENIYRSVTCDLIFVGDFTRLHLLAIYLGALTGKKVICRVHGHISFEWNMNHSENIQSKIKKIQKLENRFYKHANIIVCVSDLSARKFRLDHPSFNGKVYYCYNALNYKYLLNINKKKLTITANQNRVPIILSVGGGMRRKNNLVLAKSIHKLEQITGKAYRFIVVGSPYTDKEKICEYSFVEYYDHVSHSNLMKLMNRADLYIQNSSFDTFGIAAIEALLSGCSLLLSKKMGICEIFNRFEDGDLINNVKDINEIGKKIELLLQRGNRDRLLQSLCYENIEVDRMAQWFYKLFVSEIKK